MKLSHAILGVGVVMVTANGAAWAEEVTQGARPAASESPWYQRFTASGGPSESQKATPNQTNERTLNWSPTARWGFTLNMSDADRTKAAGQDQAAVGAFYHFTPRLRVGGEVSVAAPPAGTSGPLRKEEDSSAGVKLESAFKF